MTQLFIPQLSIFKAIISMQMQKWDVFFFSFSQ